ncbi:MAG TPA: hypothetical protein VF403_26805 [Kofleriaceae bacterium]
MKRLLVVVLAVSAFAACKKADDGTTGDDGSGSTPDATIPTMTTDVNADVTSDTTWTGLVKVHTAITIAAGATLTVDPGTVIQMDPTAGFTVLGTVNVNGAKGNVVTIGPGTASRFWGNWNMASGTVNMTYVESKGGGFSVSGTAKLMIRDSEFSQHTHDLLVIGGGEVDMQYSWIGLPDGQTDTTHCDMHVEGGNPMVTVSHSNLSTSVDGIMFYTGQGVNLTYNNWFSNQTDMDKFTATTGDVSFGWFKVGTPTKPNLTTNSMATGMVADAGPR